MAKKLHYFHLNGLAESIRYILHYAGEKFEDVRYDLSAWPIPHVKESLPYGQLPLYEEGGKSLNQSIAIARYIASKTHLLPKDPWQQAVLDAVVLNIYDFWGKIVAYIREKDPAKKAVIKQELLDEVIPFFFSKFEQELKSANGHFGGKLSWADFIFVGIIEAVNLFLEEVIEKKYPFIAALIKEIQTLPGVKEYIATRKSYKM
uniref:glutathione transferase n=1 Tax=Cnaphalocrocis medinalis TaxID=437488 RepID=A0A077D824_CNAME|nr:glutathione S-transferase sigma 3 [Cnaphalocrocis medinalis]